MTKQTLWQDLDQSFQQDMAATQELALILKKERTALEERNYEAFQKYIAAKNPLITQLEEHHLRRQSILAAAGIADEQAALELAKREQADIAERWLQLAEQWQECQRLNDINDLIAQRTRLVVGQILGLLRGQSGQAPLYTDQGGTTASAPGRTITSA